ncbi:RNA polymerase sigma factor [Amycolatopsis carbonis]|uniref:RNA polymerase sigma factor n=1 Tax=Amycolatopsis carbonis TaxID=715471 RepID=A0A9Y2N1C4_9PSEU|nr:RNA polymerase sigma factor [Amycolatopsis sp. 2-15]WIX82914.1 RNA polymerase sigma factor [Amycolatopsis sp. 2-15]
MVDEVADDGEVIAASADRPDLFAVIFDRHAASVYGYLASRLGQQIADDLLADTFLAAFSARQRYDSARAGVRPWLFGIATNMIARHRRDEVRRHRLTSAAARDDDGGHDDRVTAELAAQAMRPLLSAALAGLSQGDRDVLLLIAWEQLSYEEVAAVLAIPLGTVRSRLNRARRKVRAILAANSVVTVDEE